MCANHAGREEWGIGQKQTHSSFGDVSEDEDRIWGIFTLNTCVYYFVIGDKHETVLNIKMSHACDFPTDECFFTRCKFY